ncbi:hypothetical protein HBH56_194150 [Parastagonospora nodorum]|uniref:FAD-binding domain-containing protein n=1 Tax=Phaeosphaeria nodorum (strain SN15 / ATCC MYA-4574 / FGSC 10173) TaxID=321614 RepID=A0A7U2F7Z3_PHANO|nr:hypothetical protein HBH56_194150 [Parastagonospora nodorum]QRD00428.1 hypothetical protein JI435_089950 [Parastagonospora nodorum SN15]KAH3924935.1 hypothetical protein HBH54_189370 [Parastagonospora nodorum]KAH3953251.1 hypothetical protein HBH53_041500 [Parastagonospora nodorum]KAH3984251.1 hypothetical protein HBH51_031650 [Parastagonospora nodorum]
MTVTTNPTISGQTTLVDNTVSQKNGKGLSNGTVTNNGMSNPAMTFPSQSLRFLEKVETKDVTHYQNGSKAPELARLKLDVVIVGAGIGGLACAVALARRGHSVRVLEQAPKLGEIGAGIHIPPNAGRLLHQWGVAEHLEKLAIKPQGINLRRWEDGSVIGHTTLGANYKSDFGVPYYVVHRAHYHEALHKVAGKLGVTIQLGARVIEYQEKKGTVILEDGSVVVGDLVVAVDGINSTARSYIEPDASHEPVYNGLAAYRGTIDANRMRQDPDLAWMLEKPDLNLWIGQRRHVMSYVIAAGESLNMTWSHLDDSDPSTWPEKFDREHMYKEFSGWDPRLTKIIALIDSFMKWPLKVARPLTTWLSASSKLLVMGDAAHAMLPYMSQGAAMAVEDGAALAITLNQVSSRDEIAPALKVFEKERMKRTSDMCNASNVNGMILGLPDGPEQRARDASMAPEVRGEHYTHSANLWSDPVTQWWEYGYEAEESMEKALAKDVAEQQS